MMTRHDIINRLLRRNVSVAQLAGYAVAAFLGIAIVMVAVRFYTDARSLTDSDDSFINRDYLIVSKQMTLLNSLGASASGFTQAERDDLASQPWVRGVGAFEAADFDVTVGIDLGARSMQSAIFLETIPDAFIDISPSEWSFNPDRPVVPVIMAKDYLALYNFGFAAARGLPQLSEGVIETVPLTLTVSGQGHTATLPARIVGFSSRLNTIAVPEGFMQWANARFGKGPSDPSRLIVEVSKPGDPAIDAYLERAGLETSAEQGASRASYMLALVTGAIAGVGTVITLLALFILTLSIFLMLQKSRERLTDLMMLGYRPSAVARGFYVMLAWITAGVYLAATAVTLIASRAWAPALTAIDAEPSSPAAALIVGAVLTAAVYGVGAAVVSHKVRGYFPMMRQ